MNVLYVTDGLIAGGKERQLVELLKGLSGREEVRAELVVLSDRIHYSDVTRAGATIHILRRGVAQDPTVLFRLLRICRKFRPDVIHSWESMSSVYSLPIAKLLGVSFVNGMIRNAPPHIERFGKTWRRARLTFPFSDVIVANSLAGLRAFRPPAHKSVCIYNGFDLGRTGQVAGRGAVRTRLNIQTRFVVGMVGAFGPRKDYETYFRVASRVLRKRRDVTFLGVGEGTGIHVYQNKIPLEDADRVKLFADQTDVESIVNILDVGFLAAPAEGISNAIMEYMAFSKPVVATNNGGNPEIVVHKETGFLVEPSDIEGMIAGIESLLEDGHLAGRMGSAGKERLAREFSLEKMVDRHVELYARCISKQTDARRAEGKGTRSRR
jgi:glycosyltransferase involved in cell wall biosynthesis